MGREGKCVKVLDAAACFALLFLPGWVYILIPVLTWALLTAEETGLEGGVTGTSFLLSSLQKNSSPLQKVLPKPSCRMKKKSVCIHVHVRNHSGKRALLTGIKQLWLRFYSFIPFCLFSWHFSCLSSISIADCKNSAAFYATKTVFIFGVLFSPS